MVIAEVDQERAERALKDLAGQDEVTFVPTDISDEASAAGCAREAKEQFGNLCVDGGMCMPA